MNRFLTFFAALLLAAEVASAGPKPQLGTVLSHTSVACGTKKSKKQDIDLLRQQYVIRSGSTDYTIRQPKPDEQQIIPLTLLGTARRPMLLRTATYRRTQLDTPTT